MTISRFRLFLSLLLPRLPKLPGPSEQQWLGTLGNLGSNKEIEPHFMPYFVVKYETRSCKLRSLKMLTQEGHTCMNIHVQANSDWYV